MIRHRPLVRSPFVSALTLALVGCQPVPQKPADSSGEEVDPTPSSEVLIRSIPAEQAADLVFPPAVSDRHDRRVLVLDDEDQGTLGLTKELKVRSPYLDDDKSFSFQGRCFRVILTHEIKLPRRASTKRPVAAADGIIELSPAVAGKARWTAGNVLEFCADDHLDPEQTYTVTVKGLETKPEKGADPLTLSEPWQATFTAKVAYDTAGKTLSYIPAPGDARLITMHPLYGDKIGKRETLAVVFDQPITLEAAKAQIRLKDGDGVREVDLSHHKGKKFQGVAVDPKQVVIVRPVKSFAPGDQLTLIAWDFDGSADTGRVRDFAVARPLELTDVNCGYSYNSSTCEWKRPVLRSSTRDVWLDFNNALSESNKAARAKVSVDPPVKNLGVWVSNGWDGDGQLRISGEFEPSRRYQVTVGSLLAAAGTLLPPKPAGAAADRARSLIGELSDAEAARPLSELLESDADGA